jgi:hypothetical protein
MEPIVSMIQETGHHVANLVQVEAKRWKRYVLARVDVLEKEARDVLTPTGLERRVLVGVDGTLRAIDARVRVRLAALEKKATKRLPASRRGRSVTTRKASAGKSNGSQALSAH